MSLLYCTRTAVQHDDTGSHQACNNYSPVFVWPQNGNNPTSKGLMGCHDFGGTIQSWLSNNLAALANSRNRRARDTYNEAVDIAPATHP